MSYRTFRAGDYVLTGPSADFPVKLTSVGTFSITYECVDGVCEGVESTIFRSLAEKTADWRPASPELAAEYERRHRPAPQNWF